MFTVEQRDALRERVLRLAHEAERVVAGAVVGSHAVDGGDRFSDLDLTYGVAEQARVADVLADWTHTLIDELAAVQLAELERGPITYRVFLLPDLLQLDLSMAPAASFRLAGPRSGFCSAKRRQAGPRVPRRPRQGTSSFPRRPWQRTSSGGAQSTQPMRARASSAGESGRRSITSAPCATTRSRLPASAGGCRPCRRAATTTFPLRPLLDSRMPTSARSNSRRSGQLSLAPFSRSYARVRRRVYRVLMSSRSGSPSLEIHDPPRTRWREGRAQSLEPGLPVHAISVLR